MSRDLNITSVGGTLGLLFLKETDHMSTLSSVILIWTSKSGFKEKNTKCFSNGIEEFKKRVAENYATHLKQKQEQIK